MSRFTDGDGDERYNNEAMLWQRSSENALRGKRGKAILTEMREALLALPEKRLIEGALCTVRPDGTKAYCAVGAMAAHRGMDVPVEVRPEDVDEDEYEARIENHDNTISVGMELGMPKVLAVTLSYENDEGIGYVADWQKPAKEQERLRYQQYLWWIERELAR